VEDAAEEMMGKARKPKLALLIMEEVSSPLRIPKRDMSVAVARNDGDLRSGARLQCSGEHNAQSK
jgi:hypothetical protein